MFLREKLFLQLTAYSEDKKQKFQIIKCINHNQYFELKKIAINILQGVLPLKKDQLKYLKNSKTVIVCPWCGVGLLFTLLSVRIF